MRFSVKFLFAIRPAFLTLCLILIVVVLFVSGVPLLDWMELQTYDLRFLSRGHVPPTPAVVLALIDDKSLATAGRWPWPRTRLAVLVDHLSQDGARVIGFDIGFLEPDDNSQNDLTLAKAIQHASAAVVLGYFFHMRAADLSYQIAQEEIDRQLKRISTSKYPFVLSPAQAANVEPFLRAYALQSNLEVFTAAAASSGYFSLQNDPDGVVRWMPLTIQGGEDVFPPLALVCAWHYLGKPQLTVEVGSYGVDGIRMGQRFIPTDETGRLLINYLGPAKTFPHFSISDILHGKLPRGTFTDKIVLVGATAAGIQDVHATPLSTAYPGVEIHATVIDNILTQHFLTNPRWSKLYDLLAIIILGALMGLALPRVGMVKGLLYATGLGTGYLIIAYWMFVHTRVWLNIVYPLFVLSLHYLGHTFNSMVQQLQGAFRDLQAGEQKYRGFFADVILLHPLEFQVEQVFLIHHRTGLLLLHVAADPATTHDPDLISSMLIAIQDFMQDSFRVATDMGPETLQIGGLTVWVEQDALAVLAAVIHGTPPQTVRTLLQETLATIHQEHAEALGAFTGDATPFATSRPLLEACLVAETAPPTSPTLPRLWPRLVCLISVHRWGIVSRRQANRRWASYVQTLRAEPGIVVTAATQRRGNYCIAGLRDPLAADPDVLLATCDIDPARVTSHWQPYYALLPAFILARVQQVLDPPEMVNLKLDNGVLSATGTASHVWIVTTRQQARLIPGIAQFQEDRLLDADMQQLEALQTLLAPPETVTLRLADGTVYATGTTPHAWLVESRQRLQTLSSPVPYRDDRLIDRDVRRFTVLKECIESTVLLFCHGTVECAPGQEEKLARLVGGMQELYKVADVLGKHLRVTLLGHTDPCGTEAVYGPLGQQRADQLQAILVAHGVEARALSAVGVGMKAPLRIETTAEAQAFNCSVSFRVVVSNELQ